jgi:hypothetical protein
LHNGKILQDSPGSYPRVTRQSLKSQLDTLYCHSDCAFYLACQYEFLDNHRGSVQGTSGVLI